MSNDKNNLVYREQLDDNVIEMLSEDIGSNYSLRTENTKTIVASLNEILGKDIISNAVGSPLVFDDTFAQMGEKIHVMVNDFKAKLMSLGVSVSSIDKLASLIEKMGEIDLGVDSEELLQTYIDSLKQILIENGVEVNGDETIAELIVKVNTTLIEKDVVIENLNNKNEENEENEIQLHTLLKNVGYNVDDDSINDICVMLENKSLSPINVKYVACGDQNTFVVKEDGSLWACGNNNSGRLGLGSTTHQNIFCKVINEGVKQVSSGPNHTMVLKDDGSLWACGNNGSGQMGTGETSYSFIQVTENINNDVKQVECGRYCTFIIKNDDSLWACGKNEYGDLGLGDTEKREVFTQITDNVKQVSCGGDNHTFILKNDGSLWACGKNNKGQLGLGNTTNMNTFTQVTTNVNNDVKQVACGGYIYNTSYNGFTFILKNDGSIWSCGYNIRGQLGLGDTTTRKTFTQVTTNINNDVEQVSCGTKHVFIIKNDGSLWACGSNDHGELGINGDAGDDKKIFVHVTENINNGVKQVDCGKYDSDYAHTIILQSDNCIACCGANTYGELGINTVGVSEDSNVFTRLYGFTI